MQDGYFYMFFIHHIALLSELQDIIPRFIVLDRMNYPLVFVNWMPNGVATKLSVSYAGAKKLLEDEVSQAYHALPFSLGAHKVSSLCGHT